MARRFDHSFQPVGHPERVGYSAKKRNGQLSVVFTGPDGNRVEKGTGFKKEDANWHEEAERAIAKAYAPVTPLSHLHTFADALQQVRDTASHTRPETLRSFESAVKALQSTLPVAHVEDVSPETVKRFGRLWLAGEGTRGKRSPVTLSYYMRALSAFYNHLIELGLVQHNLWKGVKVPKAEKNKKPAPKEDHIDAFFRWVRERYPEWESLHAFLDLKAVSGSRTFDLCQMKSDQLQAGRIHFDASHSKTKESRDIPLPGELFDRLVRVKGRVHLWEGLFHQIGVYRKMSNGLPDAFSPRTIYHVVNNIFREFSDSHPALPRLSPHALRRRAITRVVMATGNVDLTAQAIGLHPQTARTYYLDAKQAFDTDGVFKALAESLLPNRGKIEGKPAGDGAKEAENKGDS
jgi:integrase